MVDTTKVGTIGIGVDVDTKAVDDAIEKIDSLGDAACSLAPMVSIRGCRECTFYIYTARNAIVGDDSDA